MHPLALVYLAVFGVLLPVGAWRSLRRLSLGPLPPRLPYFASVLVQQVGFAGLAIGVAAAVGLELFGPWRPRARDLALGLAFLATALLAMAPLWRRQVLERERFVYLVSPRTPGERGLWTAIAFAAGIGEEIVYRGVFFGLLAPWLGVGAAVLVAALAFALGHLAQGWRAAPIVFAFAVGFHLLVLATGTLFVAMAVHVLYDLIAGFAYGRLAERYGYPRDAVAPDAVNHA